MCFTRARSRVGTLSDQTGWEALRDVRAGRIESDRGEQSSGCRLELGGSDDRRKSLVAMAPFTCLIFSTCLRLQGHKKTHLANGAAVGAPNAGRVRHLHYVGYIGPSLRQAHPCDFFAATRR